MADFSNQADKSGDSGSGDDQGAYVTGAGQILEEGGRDAESGEQEVQVIQEALATARDRVDELERELNSRTGDVDDRAEHYRRGLEVMRSDQERTREKLEETARQLRKREFDLSFQEQAARTQVERFQEEIALLQQQLESGGSEQEVLRDEARRLRSNLEETKHSMEHLKQVIRERDLQLGHQQQMVKGNPNEAVAGSGCSEREVRALQRELEQAVSGRQAAEAEVSSLQQATTGTEGERLKGELEAVTRALEESNRLREETTRRAQRLEAELHAQGVVAGQDELTVIKKLRRQKEAAEEKVRQLESSLQQMRSAREREMDPAPISEPPGLTDALEALQSELELVRERAAADHVRMADEMEGLQSKLHAQELAAHAEAAESEALRKEVEQLQQQLEQGEEHQESITRDKRQLQEQIDTRNSEIDRLGQALDMARVESEEAEFKRQEEVGARKQVEEALYQAREELEQRSGRELADKGTAVPEEAAAGRAHGGRRTVIAAFAGAALVFVLADAVSILGGRGEIVTGLLPAPQKQRQVQAEPLRKVPAVIADESGGPASSAAVVSTDVAGSAPAPSPRPSTDAKRPVAGAVIQDRLASGGKGPAMIYLPGGEFTMGSERDQLAFEEQPAHPVRIKGFAIGKYEVTFAEYQRFARAVGRAMPEDQGWGKGRRPVINVSREDAEAYARWLSRQTGRRYRLPTEAEWEYAAAGGTDSYYWWGYELGDGNANCFNCGSRWDGKSTAPVGSFKANPHGLHDMAGNVMEWVQDCYHPNYQGAPADGSAWLQRGCTEGVVRGGGFNKPEDTLRTTKRSRQHSGTGLPVLGFRVVREVG